VTLVRREEYSPNRIGKIYKGTRPLVRFSGFDDRAAEARWVAKSIAADVKKEDVNPEHIIVVSLDPAHSKDHLAEIQRLLFENGVQSIVPGVSDSATAFANPGMVTLVSVYRAKGNEAPIIYVTNSEKIADYTNEIDARNKAFTAISRAKGWVTLTGVGAGMQSAIEELDRIVNDYPRFRFVFPDPDKIPALDAETSRRRTEAKKVKNILRDITSVDPEALKSITPSERQRILNLLREK